MDLNTCIQLGTINKIIKIQANPAITTSDNTDFSGKTFKSRINKDKRIIKQMTKLRLILFSLKLSIKIKHPFRSFQVSN